MFRCRELTEGLPQQRRHREELVRVKRRHPPVEHGEEVPVMRREQPAPGPVRPAKL